MLVWKAMPSMTPMMSAIFLLDSEIAAMVSTEAPTTVAALERDIGGADGQLVGLTGVVGVLFDGAGQFFHGAGGLFQRAGLLFGALAEILVAGGDFVGGGVDGVDRFADAVDQVLEVGDGGVDAGLGFAEESGVVFGDGLRQIAFGQRQRATRITSLRPTSVVSESWLSNLRDVFGKALFAGQIELGAEVALIRRIDDAANFVHHAGQGLDGAVDAPPWSGRTGPDSRFADGLRQIARR
jgi:hypothetical protein